MATNITNYFSHLTNKMYRFLKIQINFFFSTIFCRRHTRSGVCRPRPMGLND